MWCGMVLANAPNEDCVVTTGGRRLLGFVFWDAEGLEEPEQIYSAEGK